GAPRRLVVRPTPASHSVRRGRVHPRRDRVPQNPSSPLPHDRRALSSHARATERALHQARQARLATSQLFVQIEQRPRFSGEGWRSQRWSTMVTIVWSPLAPAGLGRTISEVWTWPLASMARTATW